jgi:hypothetical protein
MDGVTGGSPVTTFAGPTVVRRQLGRALKRLRTAAGASIDQVVANPELGISRAKLYRLEAGEHPVKPQDITVLCQYLKAPKKEISRLTALALATQNHSDAAIPDWYEMYRDLEPIASVIRSYQVTALPGYLQTADYARAVIRAVLWHESDALIEHRVRLRLERQQRLFGANPPPRVLNVLGEEVLTRPVGGVDVQQAQIDHLVQLARRRTVQIRVLPFSVGAHAAMASAFRILDCTDPDDPNIVYLESHVGARYLQKPSDYADYEHMWKQIYAQSVPLKEFLR